MKTTRLIEIDALRGVAVYCMIFFHALVDAQLLGLISDWHLFEGWWLVFARIVQFVFLGLVGVSVALSKRNFKEQIFRAFKILSAAFLVSFGTWLVYPDEYVRFGILHCIALSIPVVFLFKKCPRFALPVAALLFVLGEWFLRVSVSKPWFLWLGLHEPNFSSLDYFPLFPWLALPLVGLWVGSSFYAERKPTRLAFFGKISGASFLGRHSLAVYLLHQPVLYFSLWAFSHWISL